MKYIKKFETVELDYQEAEELKKYLKDQLKHIIDTLTDKSIFEIVNIRVIDKYQGAAAIVRIFGKNYKMMYINGQDFNDDEKFFIEYFPIDNCSDKGYIPGYIGYPDEVINLLNEIIKYGSIDLYISANKYNL